MLDLDDFDVLFRFPLLYQNWELDGEGWIIEDPRTGVRHALLTSHGKPYIAKADELLGRITEYNDAASATAKALELLQGGRVPDEWK